MLAAMKRFPVILLALFASVCAVTVVLQYISQSGLKSAVAELRTELALQSSEMEKTRGELLELLGKSEVYRKESRELRRALVEGRTGAPIKSEPVLENASAK